MLIETERLLLRPLTTADVEEVVAMHATPEVMRTMRGAFERPRALERLERNEREWQDRGHGLMAIVERASDRFVGRSGLKYWPQFDEVEVGWVLHPDFWGQGFATEAGCACLDWGFKSLDVPYITAMIMPENVRSIRVAERLGMRPLRHDVLIDIPVIVHSLDRPLSPRRRPSP